MRDFSPRFSPLSSRRPIDARAPQVPGNFHSIAILLLKTQFHWAVVRLDEHGQVDTSFGANEDGVQVDPITGSDYSSARAVAIQVNGKAVIVGETSLMPPFTELVGLRKVFLMRMHTGY